MPWNFTADTPIYLQIAEIIRLRIPRGEYPPGTRIPSVRELSQEAAVNPNTMQRALALLKEEGLLVTRRTTGRTVRNIRILSGWLVAHWQKNISISSQP
ncbi:MAG TPA: hypothetical protein DCM49_03755 [Lachnospiraceae bacterium]|nr:hypothetical protein [Lachnospiraceae bacterium]